MGGKVRQLKKRRDRYNTEEIEDMKIWVKARNKNKSKRLINQGERTIGEDDDLILSPWVLDS